VIRLNPLGIENCSPKSRPHSRYDHSLKFRRCDFEERFEVFPDPLNNWIVWDRDEDCVAEANNQLLQFLSEGKARELCLLLNRLISKMAA
jgi:hypothetical protein